MFLSNLLHCSQIFENFSKLAAVAGLTMFHGTGAENAQKIALEGLKARRPQGAGWIAKGVYTTANIERAAFYTHHFEHPIILEIYLSSPKRVKKMVQDPLDLDEIDKEQYFTSGDIFRIEDRIKEILQTKNLPKVFNFLNNEVENIRGNNLYKIILGVAKANDLNLQEIKKRMFKLLPPGFSTEYFEIAEDGTILLTENTYKSMHQMFYPKSLPAQVIKAVWIPKEKLKPEYISKASEVNSFGKSLIPGHQEQIVENVNYVLKPVFRSSFDLEDADDVLDDLREVYDAGGVLKELIQELQDAYNNQDLDSFIQIVEMFSPEEILYENFGTVGRETWLRFDAQNIDLRNVTEMYQD